MLVVIVDVIIGGLILRVVFFEVNLCEKVGWVLFYLVYR